jgi:hypothetical protein
VGFGPSDCSPQARRASILLKYGCSIPRITFLGSAPLRHSSMGSKSTSQFFRASSAIKLITYGRQSLDFAHSMPAAPLYCSSWGFLLSKFLIAINPLLFARNTVATDRFGCRMSNTMISPQLATLDGPVFSSSALCRENFPCLRYEVLHRWMHRMPHNHWALTR